MSFSIILVWLLHYVVLLASLVTYGLIDRTCS